MSLNHVFPKMPRNTLPSRLRHLRTSLPDGYDRSEGGKATKFVEDCLGMSDKEMAKHLPHLKDFILSFHSPNIDSVKGLMKAVNETCWPAIYPDEDLKTTLNQTDFECL